MDDTHETGGRFARALRGVGIVVLVCSMAVLVSAIPADAIRGGRAVTRSTVPVKETDAFLRAARPVRSEKSRVEILLPSERKFAAPERAQRAVGAYFTAKHAGDAAYMAEVFDAMQEAGLNAFVFDIKGSRVYYPSVADAANRYGLIFPLVDLPALVSEAKKRDLYSIARFIALKDEGLSSTDPNAQIRHPKTRRSVGKVWVDGSADPTLAYNEQLLAEVAQSGVDEINLDYIRYPTEYPQTLIGLSGREKADRIEKFLRMARKVIDAQEKGTRLGISTYAILGWNFPINFEPLGQDIALFSQIVDIVSPMAYPSTFAAGSYYAPGRDPRSRMYYLVYRTLQGYKELAGPEHMHKIRPWIQGYYVSAKDLQDQIDAVYDAGLCGFTVWSAGNHYDTFMNVWSKQHTREDTCVPAGFDQAASVE